MLLQHPTPLLAIVLLEAVQLSRSEDDQRKKIMLHLKNCLAKIVSCKTNGSMSTKA